MLESAVGAGRVRSVIDMVDVFVGQARQAAVDEVLAMQAASVEDVPQTAGKDQVGDYSPNVPHFDTVVEHDPLDA